MKKLFLFLACFCFANLVLAQVMDPLTVKLDFNYHNKISNKNHPIKNTLIFSKDNHKWTLGPATNAPFLLLARVDQLNQKSARINFIIINTENKPKIIATPIIIAAINQRAKVVFEEKESKVSLDILPVFLS